MCLTLCVFECFVDGAALMLTHARVEANMDSISNYLLHRLRADPLATPVQSTDPKQTFIPSGWDSPGLIEFQGDKGSADAADITAAFGTIVPVPSSANKSERAASSADGARSAVGGEGVTAHEDAGFLERLLRKQNADAKTGGGAASSGGAGTKKPEGAASGTRSAAGGAKGAAAARPARSAAAGSSGGGITVRVRSVGRIV